MKIFYASDIHLEFGDYRVFGDDVLKYNFNFNEFFSSSMFPNQKKMREILLNTEEHPDDILILAGDSFFYHKNFFRNAVLKDLTSKFKQVYTLPGNHEFYHPKTDISILNRPVKNKMTNNSWFVSNKKIYINGWKIIFTPLFSQIKEQDASQIMLKLNDYRFIKYANEKYNYTHHNELHKKCINFLKKELKEKVNTIIASHYLPTYKVIDDAFKGGILNSAFSAELSNLILDNPHIKYWIYGHSHADVTLKIGETDILSHQMGYAINKNNKDFKFNKYIEI